MKKLVYPVTALAFLAFAAPAVAGGGCSWMKDKEQTTEKPAEPQTS
jgi:hypothetical protein